MPQMATCSVLPEKEANGHTRKKIMTLHQDTKGINL